MAVGEGTHSVSVEGCTAAKAAVVAAACWKVEEEMQGEGGRRPVEGDAAADTRRAGRAKEAPTGGGREPAV